MAATVVPLAPQPAAAQAAGEVLDGFSELVATVCVARNTVLEGDGAVDELALDIPPYVVTAGDASDQVTVNPDWVGHAISFFTPCTVWESTLSLSLFGSSTRDLWNEHGDYVALAFFDCIGNDAVHAFPTASGGDVVNCLRVSIDAALSSESTPDFIKESRVMQTMKGLADQCAIAFAGAVFGTWFQARVRSQAERNVFDPGKLRDQFLTKCERVTILRFLFTPEGGRVGNTPSTGYWTARDFWAGAIKASAIGAIMGGATTTGGWLAAAIEAILAGLRFIGTNAVTIVPGATQNWHYLFRQLDSDNWAEINSSADNRAAILALGEMITDLQRDAYEAGATGRQPEGACAPGATCPPVIANSLTTQDVLSLLEIFAPVVHWATAHEPSEFGFLDPGLPLSETYRSSYTSVLDGVPPQQETIYRWLFCGAQTNVQPVQYEECLARPLQQPYKPYGTGSPASTTLGWQLPDSTQRAVKIVVDSHDRHGDIVANGTVEATVQSLGDGGTPTGVWVTRLDLRPLGTPQRCASVRLGARNGFEKDSPRAYLPCEEEAPTVILGDFSGWPVSVAPGEIGNGPNWGNYLHWEFPAAGPAAMRLERRHSVGHWQTIRTFSQPVGLTGKTRLTNTDLAAEAAEFRFVGTFTDDYGGWRDVESAPLLAQPALRFVGAIERTSDDPNSGVVLRTELQGASNGPWQVVPRVNFTLSYNSSNPAEPAVELFDAVMDATATFNVPPEYLRGGGTYCADFSLPAPTAAVAFWSQRVELLSRHCTDIAGFAPITIESGFGSCTVLRTGEPGTNGAKMTEQCNLPISDSPWRCDIDSAGAVGECTVAPHPSSPDCAIADPAQQHECEFDGRACSAIDIVANEAIHSSIEPSVEDGLELEFTRLEPDREAATGLSAYVCPLQINRTVFEIPLRGGVQRFPTWETEVEDVRFTSQTGEALQVPLQVFRARPTGDGIIREPTSEATEVQGEVSGAPRDLIIDWSWLPPTVDTNEVIGYQVALLNTRTADAERVFVPNGVDDTTITETAVVPGFEYCANVRVVRASGPGEFTGYNCVQTEAPELPSLGAISSAGTAEGVRWTWPPLDGDYDYLEARVSRVGARAVTIERPTSSLAIDTGPGVSCLSLRAVLSIGGRRFFGPFSPLECAEHIPAMPAVNGLQVTRHATATQWAWDHSPGDFVLYQVERSGVNPGAYSVPSTQTAVVDRLDPGAGTRCLRVRTKYSETTSYVGPWSDRVCHTVPAPAPWVESIDVALIDEQAAWTWTWSGAGAVDTELELSGATQQRVRLGAEATSHRRTIPLGEVCARVRAFNEVDEAGQWSERSCVTRLGDLSVPANLTANYNGRFNHVVWDWDEVDGADGYRRIYNGPNFPEDSAVYATTATSIRDFRGNKNCLRVAAVADDGRESAPTDEVCWDNTPLDTPMVTGNHIRNLGRDESGFVWTWDAIDQAPFYSVVLTGPHGETISVPGVSEPRLQYAEDAEGTHCAAITALSQSSRSISAPSETVCIERLHTPVNLRVVEEPPEDFLIPVTWSWDPVEGAVAYSVQSSGPRWYTPFDTVTPHTSVHAMVQMAGPTCALVTAISADGLRASGPGVVHPSPKSQRVCVDGPEPLDQPVITNTFFGTHRSNYGYNFDWELIDGATQYRVEFSRPDGTPVSTLTTSQTETRALLDHSGTICAAVTALAQARPAIDSELSVRDCATSPPPLGDVNCDADVSAIDAMFIMQHLVGIRTDNGSCALPLDGDWIATEKGDVNRDGHVDAVDALFILQCEVGIRNVFCARGSSATVVRMGVAQAAFRPTTRLGGG